jgi:hypothetical protein
LSGKAVAMPHNAVSERNVDQTAIPKPIHEPKKNKGASTKHPQPPSKAGCL